MYNKYKICLQWHYIDQKYYYVKLSEELPREKKNDFQPHLFLYLDYSPKYKISELSKCALYFFHER
jgi:hypothetical protein